MILLLFFLSLIIFLVFYIALAPLKPFWLDEGFELIHSCTASYKSLLVQGAEQQCSATPLYYIIQKTIAQLSWPHLNLFISLRLTSILAALLCIAALFYFIKRQLNFGFGFLAMGLLVQFKVFHHFAIENRPYMLWLVLFTTLILLAADFINHAFKNISLNKKIILFTVAVLLTLSTNPGALQVSLILAAFIFIFYLKKEGVTKNLKTYLFTIISPCIFLGFYYASIKCVQTSGGDYDLLLTKNWNLVKDVTSLIFPTHLQLGNIVLNILVVLGIIYPFMYYKKILQITKESSFVFNLSVIALFQLAGALAIALLVIYKHYFFIQRVFLFLIILRVILIIVGTYYLFILLKTKNSLRPLLLLSAALLMVSISQLYKEYTAKASFKPQLQGFKCEEFSLPLNFSYNINIPAEDQYSAAALILNKIGTCTQIPQNTPLYIEGSKVSDKTYQYRPVDSTKSHSILSVCSSPLTLYNNF